jgi:hypothetical protein
VAGLSIFMLIRYASGDPPAPPDQSVTPAPPSAEETSEPMPDTPAGAAAPPPLKIGGFEVPIPKDSVVSTVVSDGPSTNDRIIIRRGNSHVIIDETGLIEAKVESFDQADFQPTLDALGPGN